jgi:hypothetical protein
MNPFAERKHRNIKESAHAMRIQAGLPDYFWEESVRYAVWLENRQPHSGLNFLTPHDVLHRIPPEYSWCKTFGCLAYAYNHDSKSGQAKAQRCIFLGVDTVKMGVRLFNLETRRAVVMVSGHVRFHESVFPWRTRSKNDISPPLIELSGLNNVVGPAATPSSASLGTGINGVGVSGVSNATADQVPRQVIDHDAASASSDPPSNTNRAHDAFDDRVELPSESDRATRGGRYPSRNREPTGQSLRSIPDEDSPPPQTTVELSKMVSVTPPPPLESPVAPDDVSDAYAQVYVFTIDDRGEPLEPKNRKEAMNSPWKKEWLEAERVELEALRAQGCFKKINKKKLNGKRVLNSLWVYKLKRDENNKIVKFKARLTVRGDQQVEGEDYNDVYAAVALMKSFRLLLAVSPFLHLKATQLDIKNAFLHGNLEEEVYMYYPQGYGEYDPGCVLWLRKMLYGLRQAPRGFWKVLCAALLELGFTPLLSDSCVFKHSSVLFFICFHVDDILLFTNDEDARAAVVAGLRSHFTLNDFGSVKHYLGLHVIHNNDNTITLSQAAYIKQLAARFNMSAATPCPMPVIAGAVHSKSDCPTSVEDKAVMSSLPYRAIIGALLYAMAATRPDIAYIVITLARYSSNPGIKHWQAAKHVLRYLIGTMYGGLRFGGVVMKNGVVEVYACVDSDWGSSVDDRRSRTGYLVYVAGGLVCWKSTVQRTVALSSCEAEFMALAAVVTELLWVHSLLSELGIKHSHPMTVYIDNQAAKALAENPIAHQRTKHIDIRYFFIRETIESGLIRLEYVRTKQNPSDLLTKAPTISVFSSLVDKLVCLSSPP